MKEKVLVGISGGVDSAVSLSLLQEKNYAVSAVFLRFLDDGEKSEKALLDAKSTCIILNIPLTVVDARPEFKKMVIKYFIDEYAKGNTPNPCVFCNEKMKFKLLFDMADKLGINLVATGHYAQIMKRETYNMKQGIYKLLEAKDKNKDQSYFLYRLKQEQLARIIFPLGEYQKTDVRKLAEKFKLPVFDKNDSQDVCFMAENNLEKFLAKKINLKKGKITDTQGKVLGEHRGLPFYTIGQRKGIEIGGTGPYFVVEKNFKKNELRVTNEPQHPAITQKTITLKSVVWTDGVAPKLPLTATVRTRYHNPLICATIKSNKGQKTCQVEFAISQKAISPGQSVVFYGKDEEILGGGIII
jgi:tRNA-specific 2-thiouridylase